MPFEIIKQQFGDLTEFVVQETTTGNRFVVIPELGGIIRQLSFRKGTTLFSVLKTPTTPEKLIADTQSASELLFPFASRIPDGQYHFLGKDYQLDKNERGNKNAIHGLVRKQNFRVHEQAVQEDKAFITLHYHLNKAAGYPFEVIFAVTYSLNTEGEFSLTYHATNNGQSACPVMFGWHPYYILGNEEVDVWKISIPSNTIVEFDDNQIPTGVAPYSEMGETHLLRKELDNCFLVETETEEAITDLRSDNQDITLRITQQAGDGKFNYLVVYTPPARDCIAIEPLTGNVNCLNNGEGLILLGPGQTNNGTIKVKLF